MRRGPLIALLLGTLGAPPIHGGRDVAWAIDDDLLQLATGPFLVALWSDAAPTPPPGKSSTTGILPATAAFVRGLRGTGWVGRGGTAGIVADLLTALDVLRKYPHALVIHDVTLQCTGPRRFRLTDVKASLTVRCGADGAPIGREIQRWLSVWTASDQARIDQAVIGQTTVYTLRDKRFPATPIHWGQFGDTYIIASGSMTALSSLATLQTKEPSAPTAASPSPFAPLPTVDSQLAFIVDLEQLHERLSPVMPDIYAGIRNALGLADVHQAGWTVRRTGRAVCIDHVQVDAAGRRAMVVTEPLPIHANSSGIVPDGATTYARVRLPVGDGTQRLARTYLATRPPEGRQRWRAAFAGFEKNGRLSIDRDLLAPLAGPWVVHDYPQHPLGLPGALTIAAPISGNPSAWAAAFDRLAAQCAAHLAENDASPSDAWLRRTDDGIWYVSCGFAGPGLAVINDRVILSFSPAAVRQASGAPVLTGPASIRPVGE